MTLSIVIPTHNRSMLLRRTLEGLCEQTAFAEMVEVLVVDDGSSDDTEAVVPEYSRRLPIRYLRQPKSSVSSARNRGLNAAQGELILLLDDDVVPSPNFVREHVGFHRSHPQQQVALLGYVTWLPEIRVTPFMRWYGEYGALFGYALLDESQPVHYSNLYTCNVSFKTAFLRANGGLNETLSVYEDRELGFRLTRAGLQLYFRRSALGFHNQSFTFQQACDRVLRYSGGLGAFLSTEAGQQMLMSQPRWKGQLRRLVGGGRVALPRSLRRLIDSNRSLPHFFYRTLYWYYGTLPSLLVASRSGAKSQDTGA